MNRSRRCRPGAARGAVCRRLQGKLQALSSIQRRLALLDERRTAWASSYERATVMQVSSLGVSGWPAQWLRGRGPFFVTSRHSSCRDKHDDRGRRANDRLLKRVASNRREHVTGCSRRCGGCSPSEAYAADASGSRQALA